MYYKSIVQCGRDARIHSAITSVAHQASITFRWVFNGEDYVKEEVYMLKLAVKRGRVIPYGRDGKGGLCRKTFKRGELGAMYKKYTVGTANVDSDYSKTL